MKVLFFIWLSVVVSITAFAQNSFDSTKLSPKTLTYIKTMKSGNWIDLYPIRKNETTEFCKKLVQIAALDEIKLLVKHPFPNIRFFACYTLAHYTEQPLVPILANYIHDTTEITFSYECGNIDKRLGDLVMNIGVMQIENNPKINSHKELLTLDSILIHQQSPLDRTQNALNTAGNLLKWYAAVREYAESDYPAAIVALAKFRQEEDTTIILSHRSSKNFIIHKYSVSRNPLYATNLAISYFPHPKFFSLLEQQATQIQSNDDRLTIRVLYEAIASYQNQSAYKLLVETFLQSQQHKFPIYTALYPAFSRFYTPLYDNLLLQLADSVYSIPPTLFNKLSKKYPKKVLEICQKSAFTKEIRRKPQSIDYESYRQFQQADSTFFAQAVFFILENDETQSSLDLIVEGINKSNEQAKPFFMKYIGLLTPEEQVKLPNKQKTKMVKK